MFALDLNIYNFSSNNENPIRIYDRPNINQAMETFSSLILFYLMYIAYG